MSGTTRPNFNTIQSWNRSDSTYQCFVQELLLCQNSEKALTTALGRAGVPPAIRPPKYRVALKRSIYAVVWRYISSQRSQGVTFEAIANALTAGTGLPYKTDMISQCYQMWSSHNSITNLNTLVNLFSPPSSPPPAPASVQQTPTGGNGAVFQSINSAACSMGPMGGQDQLDMFNHPDLGFGGGLGHPSYQGPGPNFLTPNPIRQTQPQPAPLPPTNNYYFGNQMLRHTNPHLGQSFNLAYPGYTTFPPQPMQMPPSNCTFNPVPPQHVHNTRFNLCLSADPLLNEYVPADNAYMQFHGLNDHARFHGSFM